MKIYLFILAQFLAHLAFAQGENNLAPDSLQESVSRDQTIDSLRQLQHLWTNVKLLMSNKAYDWGHPNVRYNNGDLQIGIDVGLAIGIGFKGEAWLTIPSKFKLKP